MKKLSSLLALTAAVTAPKYYKEKKATEEKADKKDPADTTPARA